MATATPTFTLALAIDLKGQAKVIKDKLKEYFGTPAKPLCQMTIAGTKVFVDPVSLAYLFVSYPIPGGGGLGGSHVNFASPITVLHFLRWVCDIAHDAPGATPENNYPLLALEVYKKSFPRLKMPTRVEFEGVAMSRNHGGPGGGGGDLTSQDWHSSCVKAVDGCGDEYLLKEELALLGVQWVNRVQAETATEFGKVFQRRRAELKAASASKLPAVVVATATDPEVVPSPPKKRQRSPKKKEEEAIVGVDEDGTAITEKEFHALLNKDEDSPVKKRKRSPKKIATPSPLHASEEEEVALPTPPIEGKKKRKSPSGPRKKVDDVKAAGRPGQGASPPSPTEEKPKKPRKPRAKKQKLVDTEPEDEVMVDATQVIDGLFGDCSDL